MSDPLSKLDLNLLLALEALLEERQVTRAAKRLHVTQSAMSHTLGRLRDALEDEVVVRQPHGMQPTPRALALAEPVGRALEALRAALSEHRDFDPSTFGGTFRLATITAFEALAVPAIYQRLRSFAPYAQLDLCGGFDEVRFVGVAQGKADCALVTVRDVPPGLLARSLPGFEPVVITRAAHPRIKSRLTLKTFTDLEHVIMGTHRHAQSYVDDALAARGKTRKVALRVQSVLALPEVVARTDLVAVVPPVVAQRSGVRNQLDTFRCPVPVTPPPFQLLWHPRVDRDPAQVWFRELILKELEGLFGTG